MLAGATGLVGREVAAQWPGPAPLYRLVRRAGAGGGTAAKTVVVDFARLPALPRADWTVCCLGTTIAVAGSQAAFRAVDFDAVLAFAQAARKAGASRLAVVSSLGADAKSANFYSRTKGEMEQALRAMDWPHLVIARPSLLAGNRGELGQPARPGEALALGLTRPLRGLIPLAWRPIEAAVLARALLRALAQAEPGTTVLGSAALQRLGA